jgi:pyridoxal phosphate enzyme (YggS family)
MSVMEAAVEAGIRVFGENYPEEAREKIGHFHGVEGIEWHMIGHLQSRKARLVVESFQWLHSLDSLHLAEKLNAALASSRKSLRVLIEMNVSGEESKFGWPALDENQWGSLIPDFEKLAGYPQLNICGLMTMPPFSEDPEEARPYFGKLRRLRDFLEGRLPVIKIPELSMGTSADFLAAVKEGATFVRVGQAILGSRPARRV